MKKVLVSLLLVLTLVMSSFCCVNAAIGDMDWFKGKFLSQNTALNADAEKIDIPVTVKVKSNASAAVEYSSSVKTKVGGVVDFIAELDMTDVKNLIALSESLMSASDFNDVKSKTVTGQFVINANWENVLNFAGGTPLTTGGLSGFKFYDVNGDEMVTSLFTEGAARTTVTNNGAVTGVTATISIASGKTVADVLNELPTKITLEQTGFEVLGFGDVTGSFTVAELASVTTGTYTEIDFGSADKRYIDYNFVVSPATVSKRVTGGGGGGTTNKPAEYTVTFNTNGGNDIEAVTVESGKTVSLPTPSKDGYKFEGWYTDSSLKNAFDAATKITKNITLYANWTEEIITSDVVCVDHTDIDIEEWYHEGVHYCIENGLMVGATDTTFEPETTVTRAMLVTVLWRAEDEAVADKDSIFTDLEEGSYYKDAVIWADEKGIVNGVSDTEFAPNDIITREQFATIMYRYAQFKGFDVSVGENTNILSYTDYDKISEYAIPAMQYAVGSGLLKGRTESTLNPDGNATRAEMATILYRFLEANK